MAMNKVKAFILWVVFFGVFYQALISKDVKILHVPDNVKVIEDSSRISIVADLEKHEIFRPRAMYIVDNFIYLERYKPRQLAQLSLDGKSIKYVGRTGRGPGELSWIGGIQKFRTNIAVVDYKVNKLAFFNKSLEYINEKKVLKSFMYFQVNDKNQFILAESGYGKYYFHLYTENLELLRSFGKRLSFIPGRKKRSNRFDEVRHFIYIPEEEGIWASFKDRYDLRYYKNERLAIEIKGPEQFFEAEKREYFGREVLFPLDRSKGLAKIGNHLYYFYSKKRRVFCDIFDVEKMVLLRRMKIKLRVGMITHYKDKIFYYMAYENDDKEKVLLYKIEFY
jgi:hypothetical protein